MIKDKSGFSGAGSWYKGNLHSHTVNSDGNLKPEEAVQLFKAKGYHFLCFSEHDLYTDYRSEFDCEDFIILPGLEASASLFEEKDGSGSEYGSRAVKVHHIHGILGTEQMQRAAGELVFKEREEIEPLRFYGDWKGAETAQKLNDYMKSRGCITTYNHPIWSRVAPEEFIYTDGIWALEIFNYTTVNETNTGFDTTYWDLMLRQRRDIFGIATDDNHNEGLFVDTGGGYIVVKAPELTHEDILQNMISGNYYSSAGPEIYDWGVKDGVAYVKCSPVYRIDFITAQHINDGASRVCCSYEETMDRAEYRLRGDETYIRVECTDKYGRTAWSNPMR